MNKLHPETFEERMEEEATSVHTKQVLSEIKADFTLPTIKRPNKALIIEYGNELARQWDDKPLEGYIRLRAFLSIIERGMEKLKGFALEEARKYKGDNDMAGATFRHTEGKRMFDYSNDSVWRDLKEKLKAREEFLKGIKTEMADTNTGEICQPPIVKYASDSININFK